MAITSMASEMNGYQNPHHSHAEENIAELQTKVNRLDTIMYTLIELLKENGIEEEKIFAKVNEVVAGGGVPRRANYEPVIAPCPQCGRNIQESRSEPLVGRCLFCNARVVFYPYTDKFAAMARRTDTDNTNQEV